jgi:hypothetical protein
MPLGRSRETKVVMELNGPHQLLVYTDDVNLLGDNIDTIKKHMETDASNEVGLKVKAKKTTYMLSYHQQNAGKKHDMKAESRSFENVIQFKCLGTAVTNQTLSPEEIKRRLHSGNTCYH